MGLFASSSCCLLALQTVDWNTGCWLVSFAWCAILWLLAQLDKQDEMHAAFLFMVMHCYQFWNGSSRCPFNLLLLKIITLLKMIPRYYSVPDWNLHNTIPLSAMPILPSINHKALRFISSSYWMTPYDIMLPRLKQRFLDTSMFELHHKRSPQYFRSLNSVIGAVLSDRSDIHKFFKPK